MAIVFFEYKHLSVWADRKSALVYCRERDCLAELDLLSLAYLEQHTKSVNSGLFSRQLRSIGITDAAITQAEDNLLILLDSTKWLAPLPYIPTPSYAKAVMPANARYICNLEHNGLLAALYSTVSDTAEVLNQLGSLPKNKSKQAASLAFCIEENEDGYQIMGDNRVLNTGLHKNQISSALAGALFRANYLSQDYSFVFHGAAVLFEGVIWLMPASSGAGKSTLCYQLVQSGGYCFSDDALALDQCFQPIPLNMPICLKEGVWDLIGHQHAAPLHRIDGRKFYYHWLDQCKPNLAPDTPRVVLSPKYDKAARSLSEQRLSLADVVSAFVANGYQLNSGQYSDVHGHAIRHWLDDIASLYAVSVSFSETQEIIAWMRAYAAECIN